MPRRAHLLPLSLALLALGGVAAGCGFRKEPTTTEQLRPVYPLTVKDADGRSVVLQRRPQNVVTLDPGAARILQSLGVQAQLLPSSTKLDTLGGGKADLIVLPGTTSTASAANLAKRLEVPTFVFASTQLQPIEHAALSLGIATGHVAAGEETANRLRARRASLAKRLAGLPPTKVFIDVVGVQVPPPPQSLIATIVKLAGGQLVGTDDPGVALTPQQLARLKPDWYIANTTSGLTLARLRTRPRIAKVKAIREGHFMTLDLSGVQPDDRAYALVQRLARKFHPDAFS